MRSWSGIGRASGTRSESPRLIYLNTKDRYLRFTMSGGRQVRVHRIVCEVFHGPAPAGADARHLDGNSHNNRAENLAWGSRLENMADARAHGTTIRGERNPNHRLTVDDVRQIRAAAASGVELRDLALQFGIQQSSIKRVVTGDRWGWVQ